MTQDSSSRDELICRSRKGWTSPGEEEDLLAWRRASVANEEYYREMIQLLDLAEATLSAPVAPEAPPAAELIRLAEEESVVVPMRRSGWNPGWWLGGSVIAAAAAITLIALGVLDFSFAPRPAFSLGGGEFVTGAAEKATVTLSDGTVVRLAPDSRLRISSAEGTREVFLDGQAYFAVAKMQGYPFRVRTRVGEALVLGTRFEVRVQDEDLRLVVLEGKVALGAGSERVEVEAGEMGLVTDGTPTSPVKVDDIKPLVPWLERFIVFQSTPLREVARELEREYGVRVEVRDSARASQTITGWYADRRFEEVLAIVCGVLQAECSIENGIATIR